MGTTTFLLPEKLPAGVLSDLDRACPTGGADNMPMCAETSLEADRLLLRRGMDESACYNIPWAIENAGQLMGSTTTLPTRELPYRALIELARGKVHHVRCQLSEWRSSGLQVPPSLDEEIRAISSAFCQAMIQQSNDPASAAAQTALNLAFRTAEQLVQLYVSQVYQTRQQRTPRLDTTLGCRISQVPNQPIADGLNQCCNALCLPLTWKDTEPERESYRWETADTVLNWAADRNFNVTAGPLIDFSAGMLPNWLWGWEDKVSSIGDFMCRYVETAVRRYRGRIRRWQLTAGANCADVLNLGDEDLLWLTNRLYHVARQVEPNLELSMGIAQPWGEYGTIRERYSPFMFADTLTRSGLHLSALDIEIIMGVTPRGSYCRDLLDTSRLLDLYALLDLPLQVTLGYPSASEPDLNADPDYLVDAGHWRDGCTPAVQAEWSGSVAALALCKPYVRSVEWIHAADNEPHQFPHCGLVDAEGNIKPALNQLRNLREQHLR